MSVTVTVTEGHEKGRSFSFNTADRFLIGRAREAHFRFSEQDRYISRQHCLLEVSSAACFIRDLNSKNGTWINGSKIRNNKIKNNARIQLGDTSLLVQIVPDGVALPLHPEPPVREEYVLLGKLGEGGMGEIFKAEKNSTREIVAFKWLHPHRLDRSILRLFAREIKVMERLQHQNIVRILDKGIKEGRPFLVSEYLPGKDVGSFLLKKNEPLSLTEACRIICDTLDGLGYAHREGYVHRDIKPENILLTSVSDGEAKLSDFGFTKSYVEAGGSMFTHAGEIGGTLVYMAPEQITQYRFVKPQADLYSLGVTLYYLLSGCFPYPIPSPFQMQRGQGWRVSDGDTMEFILHKKPALLQEICPNLPLELGHIIEHALEKKPENRYQNAEEMKLELEKILQRTEGGTC